jgi:hypothetical protein
MKGGGRAGRGEGDVVSWLSKECRRCGRYQRTMGLLSVTSSRLLAANVILRVWAGSRQGLGRVWADSQAGVATGKASFAWATFI